MLLNKRAIIVVITFIAFGVSKAFSQPNNIPDLLVWLRADSGIVHTSQKVSYWEDLSGNNNHAVQNNSNNQPLYINQVSEIANNPTIRFNGSSEFLLINSGGNVGSAYIVLNWRGSLPNFPDYNGIITQQEFSPSTMLFAGKIGSSKLYDYEPDLAFNVQDYKVNDITSLDLAPLQDYKIVSAITSTAPKSLNNFIIGREGASLSRHWNGDISEIIIFKRPLTLAENNNVIEYLRNKYAPPVSLGQDLTYNYRFCSTLNTSSGFTSYLWSTGDTSPTISVNKSGIYWVKVKDIFGFESSDTIRVTFPTVNIPQSNYFLCENTSLTWNTSLPKSSFSFLWSDSSSDSLLSITQPGQYYVTITDTFGCTFTSDTVTVTIDNFSSIATLGPDTSFCSGNLLYLKQGASSAQNYLWNDSSTNDSLMVTTAGQYFLQVTNNNGCVATDTINVTINGVAATPAFTGLIGCDELPVQFMDKSVPASGVAIDKWNWNFGDMASANNNSNFQNPQHVFSDTGIFNVTLTIETAEGCLSSKTQQVHIYPKPTPYFTSLNSCENSITSFVDQSTSPAYSIKNWTWTFDNSSISNVKDPEYVFSSKGTYQVKLLVSNEFGCSDSITKTHTVKPQPVASFSTTAPCKGREIDFFDSSTIPTPFSILKSLWSFNGDPYLAFNAPSQTYNQPGEYTVSYLVQATNGCSDTITKKLIVSPTPDAAFTTSVACAGKATSFYNNSTISSGNLTDFIWNFGNNNYSRVENPVFAFPASGTKNIKLIVITDKGCTDTVIKQITVSDAPKADFSFSPLYGNPPLEITFENNSSGGDTYSWVFSDGFVSFDFEPQHVFSDSGIFNITLISSNVVGCTDTIVKSIIIEPLSIDVAVLGVEVKVKDSFAEVSTQLANFSTADIRDLQLELKLHDGSIVRETISKIKKYEYLNYTFKSRVQIPDSNRFICVTAILPAELKDKKPENNSSCSEIFREQLAILDVYPNPTDKEAVIAVLSPVEDVALINIYNAKGVLIKSFQGKTLIQGVSFLNINVSDLGSGFYTLEISTGKALSYKKLIKY